MEVILFVVLVAAVAVVGVGFGLAVAPRLSRWDERRSGADSDDAIGGGEEHDRE
jgi:hypothetical protein